MMHLREFSHANSNNVCLVPSNRYRRCKGPSSNIAQREGPRPVKTSHFLYQRELRNRSAKKAGTSKMSTSTAVVEFRIPVSSRDELLKSSKKQGQYVVRDVLDDSDEIRHKLNGKPVHDLVGDSVQSLFRLHCFRMQPTYEDERTTCYSGTLRLLLFSVRVSLIRSSPKVLVCLSISHNVITFACTVVP